MKNLKNMLGLLAISGVAFGFAGTVNATNPGYQGSGANEFINCLQDTSATNTCTLTKGGMNEIEITSSQFSSNIGATNKLTIVIENGVTLKLGTGVTLNVAHEVEVKGGGTIVKTDSSDANIFEVSAGGKLTTSNITLNADATSPANDKKPVILVVGGNVTSATSNVIVNAGTVINGYAGIVVRPNGLTSAGNAYANVTVNGGTIKTNQYAVHANGLINGGATKVDIKGGTFESTENVALYAAGVSTWNVANATVKGLGAVMIKGGDVTITSGTYTATGKDCTVTADTNFDSNSNAEKTGAAVTVIQQASYGSAAKATIKGGTFKSETCSTVAATTGSNTIVIDDGTFTAPKDVETLSGTTSYYTVNGGQYSKVNNTYLGGKQAAKVGNSYVIGDNVDVYVEVEGEHGEIKTLNSNPFSIIKGYEFAIKDFVTLSIDEGYHAVYTAVDGNNEPVEIVNWKITVSKESDISKITVKITFAEGAEPEQEPSDPEQKPSTGDNEPSENPKTFDAIGSLVTMAVSSLGVIGTATKKVLR